MEKKITLSRARQDFSHIIKDVYDNENVYIIFHYHRKVAVIRRPDEWRQSRVTKTETQIENLLTQIKNLLKECL